MIKIHKPKTIKEAVEDLCTFLECDLYSKFRPEHQIKGETYVRTDQFQSEKEMVDYLREHFDLLLKQIREINTNDNEKHK